MTKAVFSLDSLTHSIEEGDDKALLSFSAGVIVTHLLEWSGRVYSSTLRLAD